MSAENPDVQLNHQPNDPAPMRGNGRPDTQPADFARRAQAFLAGFPANLEAMMRRNPYATVGIACAIGVGAGIVLGSRILRAMLVSTVSYAALEFGRAYVRQNAGAAPDAVRPGAVTAR
jgi:hypothetical protein